MLPQPVYIDIFDIAHQASQIAIEHICDELERFELMTLWYDNFDHAIIIYFADQQNDIEGELRIDRIRKCFDVSVAVAGQTVLPSSGDWDHVCTYLRTLDELL